VLKKEIYGTMISEGKQPRKNGYRKSSAFEETI
jgi:hypothetical protein